MPQPKPKSTLDDACAAIWDGTLYVYTPDSFQSLPLEEGAQWKKLDMGEPVQGAACVGSTADDAAFWLVGGTGSSTGLQKFSYATRKWETITPQTPVTQNRLHHSVSYLEADDKILMFSGTTDGAEFPTAETFTIKATEPYQINGYPSAAPNSLRPLLLPWSDDTLAMVGGDPGNTRVYLFNSVDGWRNSGATLAAPIPKDPTQVKAATVQGPDGSQNLYLFDMTVSPNEVSRMVLQDASGAPVVDSAPITKRSTERRQSTEGNWPAYNSTLAPTEKREGYGIAQGSDGKVFFVGGNSKEPVSMFDALENSWLDADDFFTEQRLGIQGTSQSSSQSASQSASTSATASSTASASASATATESTSEATTDAGAVAGSSEDDNDDGGPSSGTVLGITLGSIFAFLLVLVLVLFLLRRRNNRRTRETASRDEQEAAYHGDEKHLQAFVAPTPSPPPSVRHFRGHHAEDSMDSFSSVAILMGRMNQGKQAPSKRSEGFRSSIGEHYKQFKSTISKPIPQENDNPMLKDVGGPDLQPSTAASRPRDGPPPDDDGMRRSSGWNKYWSGGSALQILGFGAAKRGTVVSEMSSQYSQGPQPSDARATQDSATVPPLTFEGQAAMNHVNSGSPVVTVYDSKEMFGEGVPGQVERPRSGGSLAGYSSGVPESVHDVWGPAGGGEPRPWGADRAPSSVYEYGSGANFGTTTLAPGGGRAPPSGVSSQPQLAMASKSSDMSWLNLGDQSQKDQRRT